jgi:type IV secretion system protein VirB10
MEQEQDQEQTKAAATAETETPFEMSPEDATGFGRNAAPWFDRKKVMVILAVSLVMVVGVGLVVNTNSPGRRRTSASGDAASAARTPSDFLQSLSDTASRRPATPDDSPPVDIPELDVPSAAGSQAAELARPQAVPETPPPQQQPPPASGPPAQDPLTVARRSPLVPPVAGSLFSGSAQYSPASDQYPGYGPNAADDFLQAALAARSASTAAYPSSAPSDPYSAQNNQENKQSFYDSGSGGGVATNGRFLGANALWIGTVVPGVLETAINTDLPGNVLARVTQNVYDSQTGRSLLIPQGTVLVARYNSSVSYAQHRVQIVWDTLIRPDGLQIDLEGMNSVDRAGMSGQEAVYHENWFEYLKAAGIVTLFSIANASMTETAARYSSDATASAIASSNSELVNQLGGSMVGRAMNIQPTLTVDNGTLINVMLNKTMYLPPVESRPVTQKYRLN